MIRGFATQDSFAATLPPDYPIFQVEIVESNGALRFQFYWKDKTSFEQDVGLVKVQYVSVYLRGQWPPLWRLYCPPLVQRPTHFTYGLVPAGCVQEDPAAGPAPPLTPGQEYMVGANGDGGVGAKPFTYQGR